MDPFYGNQLKNLLSNPGSFERTPGFNFALDTGLEGVKRKLAVEGKGDSGNALAELMQYGTGLANQEYGNQIDRLGRLTGQEQQYGLGQEQNANNAQNNAWNYDLGQGRLANDAQNNWWNYNLGQGQNANTAARNANDFNTAQSRTAVDWFNAGTNRGQAQSNDWFNNQNNQLNWAKYNSGGR